MARDDDRRRRELHEVEERSRQLDEALSSRNDRRKIAPDPFQRDEDDPFFKGNKGDTDLRIPPGRPASMMHQMDKWGPVGMRDDSNIENKRDFQMPKVVDYGHKG